MTRCHEDEEAVPHQGEDRKVMSAARTGENPNLQEDTGDDNM